MKVSDKSVGTNSGLFFFQAEDGIRDLVRSRGLGDVYKRQDRGDVPVMESTVPFQPTDQNICIVRCVQEDLPLVCLLYTSDAADDLLCVDLGGRRIIKKKNLKLHY